jgi:hypothetical protein
VEVVPVPVFYPDVTHILGQQVYRRVADVPGALSAAGHMLPLLLLLLLLLLLGFVAV